jgi:hypothetical protein
MKTVDLTGGTGGAVITLELNELELTTLVALVEQGQQRLCGKQGMQSLHGKMAAIADEFCSLLAHLELLAADD